MTDFLKEFAVGVVMNGLGSSPRWMPYLRQSRRVLGSVGQISFPVPECSVNLVLDSERVLLRVTILCDF